MAVRTIITRSPLRISFVGGGSDIPTEDAGDIEVFGATVNAAIDRYAYALVRPRSDDKVYVTTAEKEIVDFVSQVKNPLVRQVLTYFGIQRGIEIVLFADISSIGTGLGCSSALAVALCGALSILSSRLSPRDIDATQLRGWQYQMATIAADIEMNHMDGRGGAQDHFISALGSLRYTRYGHKGLPSSVSNWRWFDAGESSLRSWISLYASPHDRATRRSKDVLGTFEDTDHFRDKCIQLSESFFTVLDKMPMTFDDGMELAYMIREHDTIKRGAFGLYMPEDVSEIFDAVYTSRSRSEPIGLKLCGAGNGGHILCLCPPQMKDRVKCIIESRWGPEVGFKFVREGLDLVFIEDGA